MNAPSPEFSRIINTARLSPKGIEELLEAKPAERAALAKRFDLIDLPKLVARITLTPGSQQTVEATGTIEAEIVQQCIVTLDPITTHLNLNLDIIFVPAEKVRDDSEEQLIDDIEEEIETFSDGKIDLGEMIAQQLGVNINLYPRKAEASLTNMGFSEEAPPPRPFSKLKNALSDKKNKEKKKDTP